MAPATVLVVDDDPVILKLLEVNFEMEGFEVVRAADGEEGLERAREVLPDIVILDVMMPRMTGYEVAKALREDDDTAHIPIIFVTARAQSNDVERGMELGVDDYVTKPFDPLDLIARVQTLLARRATPAEANGNSAAALNPEAPTGVDAPRPGSPPAGSSGPEAPEARPDSGSSDSGSSNSGSTGSGAPGSGPPAASSGDSGSSKPAGESPESRPL